jgi:hypothetical protein
MTSWQLLRAMQSALQPGIEADKGAFVVAHDVNQYLDALASSPARWRVILGFEREESFGDPSEQRGGLVYGTFFATVQMHKDFSIRTGDDFAVSRSGEPPILMRSEQLVASIRGFSFPAERTDVDHAFGFRLVSREWVEQTDSQKQLHRSLQARLVLGYTLPPPVEAELSFP